MKLTKGELKILIEDTIQDELDKLNETNFDKVNIPATIKRWMNKFIGTVKDHKLEKIRKLAILFHIVKALGINPQELNVYVNRIRKGLK